MCCGYAMRFIGHESFLFKNRKETLTGGNVALLNNTCPDWQQFSDISSTRAVFMNDSRMLACCIYPGNPVCHTDIEMQGRNCDKWDVLSHGPATGSGRFVCAEKGSWRRAPLAVFIINHALRVDGSATCPRLSYSIS